MKKQHAKTKKRRNMKITLRIADVFQRGWGMRITKKTEKFSHWHTWHPYSAIRDPAYIDKLHAHPPRREHEQTGSDTSLRLLARPFPRPRLDDEDYLRARRLCDNVVGPGRSVPISFCFASPATCRQHWRQVEVRMFPLFGSRSRRSNLPCCQPPQHQRQHQQRPTRRRRGGARGDCIRCRGGCLLGRVQEAEARRVPGAAHIPSLYCCVVA